MLYEKAVFLGKWILDLANFPDIFYLGHPYSENMAWHRKTSRFQRVFPKMEEAKLQRSSSSDFRKGH
jgi:hypothetical protein